MDPSTQKLLDRTRQRREQMNQQLGINQNAPPKITPAKRKTSDSDKTSQNSRETPSKKSSFNENDDEDEIVRVAKQMSNGRTPFYPLEELEQLAKDSLATNDDDVTYENVESKEEIQANSFSRIPASAPVPITGDDFSNHKNQDSVSPKARKARLAALAAKIGSYEDEISSHTPSSAVELHQKKTISVAVNLSVQPAPAARDEFKPKVITPVAKSAPIVDFPAKTSPKNVSVAKSPVSENAEATCGVESFFIRKTSTPDAVAVQNANELMERKKQPTPEKPAEKKQTSTEKKQPAPEKQQPVQEKKHVIFNQPPLAKRKPGAANEGGKVSAMVKQFESQLLNPPTQATKAPVSLVAVQDFREPIVQPKATPAVVDVHQNDTVPKKSPRTQVPVKQPVAVVEVELPKSPRTPVQPQSSPTPVSFNAHSSSVSYDGGSSSDSEFVDSAELYDCLDEAIDSATLAAAQKSPYSRPVPQEKRPINVGQGFTAAPAAPAAPLMYTVSMYRRMQKEQSSDGTPIKTVVKPPSSPHRRTVTENKAHNNGINSGVYERKVKTLTDSITVQQEQIYQASRALRYCRDNEEFRGSTEEVDAHKILLVAGERRKALQQELDRLQELRKQRKPLESDDPLGTLTFQYVSLSLKREFVNDRINSMGDYVYYFVCILKYRDQLLTTQFVDSDLAVRNGGRIEFTNYFHFKSLPHDFNVEVSIFCLQAKREELSHEQKYHLKGSTLKHKQRPNSAVMSTSAVSLGGPGCVLDTNFRLVGQVNLTLGSVTRQKFALQGFQMVAPLEPGIHLKMRCCADSVGTVEEKGFLSVYEEVSHLGSWHRRWCTLKDGVLRFWSYPDEEQIKDSISNIDLVRCVTRKVDQTTKDICTRPNTFVLDIQGDNLTDVRRHLLSADNKEECLGWCEKLNQALHNLRLWNVESFVL